jgi:hypothetical protein
MSSYDSADQLLHAAHACHHAYAHADHPSQNGSVNWTVGPDSTNVNPILGTHPMNANRIVGRDRMNGNLILGRDPNPILGLGPTKANLSAAPDGKSMNWSDGLPRSSHLPPLSLLQSALERAGRLYGQLLPLSSCPFHCHVDYLPFPISS